VTGSLYTRLHETIRGNRLLDAAASGARKLVPDLTLSRNVPFAGRLAFGLRRHHWLLGNRCFEGHRRTLGLFARMIRQGDVLYDIGANIGYYARFAAAQFPVSQIVAFEPMRANVRLLRRNAATAGASIRVLPVVLSDRDERCAELQVDDMSDGSAVLSRVSGGAAAHGRASAGLRPKAEAVETWRLDTLLFDPPAGVREAPLPRPDVMKIDTEGAEELVLAGAIRTLGKHRPRLILAMHGSDRARRVLNLLEAEGYFTGGWVRSGAPGSAEEWRCLAPQDAPQMSNNNCIASAHQTDIATEPAPLDLSTCRP
jgi:FkbM family methyltransferase